LETKIEGLPFDQVEYRVAGQEERYDDKDNGYCDGGGMNVKIDLSCLKNRFTGRSQG